MSYRTLAAGVGVSLLLAGTTLAESRVFEVPDFDAVSI